MNIKTRRRSGQKRPRTSDSRAGVARLPPSILLKDAAHRLDIPRYALVDCRIFIEQLAKMVAVRHGLPTTRRSVKRKENLKELIDRLEEGGHLSRKQASKFHLIRLAANRALHGDDVTTNAARRAYTSTVELARWFARGSKAAHAICGDSRPALRGRKDHKGKVGKPYRRPRRSNRRQNRFGGLSLVVSLLRKLRRR